MTDTEDELWELFYPGEPKPERHIGAVDEYAGSLGKLLPDDVDVDGVMDK